ncbi:MAG: hypothetical protein CR967_05190 [Proteobacteria bacterium]|nr:MAG: hypothetical protein CR967_05190 [Pseudomonadota bacterium]
MKFILFILVSLIFASCSLDQKSVPPQTKPTIKTPPLKKLSSVPQKQQKINSNMIRGTINSQKYDEASKKWIYEIEVDDMVSNALEKKVFSDARKMHDVGDLVYAVFYKNDLNRLKKMYLIKKQHKKILREKKYKRVNSIKTPWISVPLEETVILK